MEQDPRITIVVTQRESFAHTRSSLESLYATTHLPFALVYVDGGSPPRTKRYLQREAKRRNFKLVRREEFLTPNQARNIGFSFVTSELVTFVENDVVFRDRWLNALVDCADQESAAIVGPLIYFRRPAFSIVHSAGGTHRFDITPTGKHFRHLQRHEMSASSGNFARAAVDFVEFHCFLARADIMRRCGPFDEGLKTCNEFDDFCLTVTAAGGRIFNEPAAVVQHVLPLPPPRGFGDRRFLKARWDPRDNAASVSCFRRKWQLGDDDPFMREVAAWCDARPYSIVANTPVYRFARTFKRAFQQLAAIRKSHPKAAAVNPTAM